ncbi:iron-containing alcohol dehydrogenase [Roseixanthobacter pseudopolyaromaticivorans]|uniref:iron-containing alcohol dehydrogenase n=1 Tax=Roseixanthobacter pseudopolyaromaticivorans TaxID=3119920 RepID=UPI003B57E9D9
MPAISLPRALRIGAGTTSELPAALAQLGLKAPAIITDDYLMKSGGADRIATTLAAKGMTARIFSGVVPDPTTSSVNAALQFVAEGQHDCVVGFGGGSSIDTAKAVAVLAARGGSMRALKAPHQEDAPGLPIVAIPTTAGTGSEATRFTIITDDENDEKMLCAGMAYMPVLAIVDYELTMTAPRRLTADTGIDALTHAIEAYVSRLANPFSDSMAIAAMRAIWPNLRRVYETPDDRPAREAMMIGSLQAGIAFSNSSVALVHGMSRPIGAHFHVAHGLSNAMLLPVVTAWSAPSAERRYAECARAMGIATPEESDESAVARLIEALREVNRELAVPSPKTFGIDESRWNDLMPVMAEQALASGSPGNNPRVPDADTIQTLYRQAWA